LADLPNLGKLVVNHCKIRSIAADTQRIQFSKSLTHVELAFNHIADWEFVDALPEVFVGLKQLRISHNPLFQQLRTASGRLLSEDDGYMLTVAHLGALRVLNYSPVSDEPSAASLTRLDHGEGSRRCGTLLLVRNWKRDISESQAGN
jgi:hypothetical protein